MVCTAIATALATALAMLLAACVSDTGDANGTCPPATVCVQSGGGGTELEFVFDDLGDNLCGCPDAVEPCRVVSSSLAPPDPWPRTAERRARAVARPVA